VELLRPLLNAMIHVRAHRGIAVHVEFEYVPEERAPSSPPPPSPKEEEKEEKKKRENHSTPILQLYRSR
jgi:hypothetical protein